MNKIVKTVVSIVTSFAMAVCLASTSAGAAEISPQEYEISPASVGIGVPYHISDSRGKITAQFVNQSKLLVTYTDLTNKSRYIKMYVSAPSKSFEVRTFVVKANKAHSESYNISSTESQIKITVYRHTTSSSSSSQIDPIVGILP